MLGWSRHAEGEEWQSTRILSRFLVWATGRWRFHLWKDIFRENLTFSLRYHLATPSGDSKAELNKWV